MDGDPTLTLTGGRIGSPTLMSLAGHSGSVLLLCVDMALVCNQGPRACMTRICLFSRTKLVRLVVKKSSAAPES